MKFFLFSTVIFLAHFSLLAQNPPIIIPLWENGAPGFEDKKNEPELAKEYWVKNVHNPSITVFKAENPNGSAVLIFPGGGHGLLVFDEEGTKAAKYLNSLGVTGIVLKYRLFREEHSPYSIAHPKQDAIRAMQVIRHKAIELGIDTDRIGIMGFSAGGEVANMIAYENFANKNSKDAIDHENSQPNFQIQIYPGPLGIPKKVSPDAIPAFLLASNNDACCSISILNLLIAYREAKAPVEAHFYAKDAHGFNMGDHSKYRSIYTWSNRLGDWLIDHQFFN